MTDNQSLISQLMSELKMTYSDAYLCIEHGNAISLLENHKNKQIALKKASDLERKETWKWAFSPQNNCGTIKHY